MFLQVKEMGAIISECGCMAEDIGKIFDAYWYLAEPTSQIPSVWPPSFDTKFNNNTPMEVNFNGTRFQSFMSVSILVKYLIVQSPSSSYEPHCKKTCLWVFDQVRQTRLYVNRGSKFQI